MSLQITYFIKDHPYKLLHAVLAGSHGFGYGMAESDYDIHGIHLLPLDHVLGFDAGGETVERKRKPMEMATHDIKKFCWLLYKGNGNVLEDLYNTQIQISQAVVEEIKALGKQCITKQVANHYRGMAYNQQKRMKDNPIKSLMHSYRCLMMGIHAMRTGEICLDVPELARIYDQPGWNYLYSLRSSRSPLKETDRHLEDLKKLNARLDEEQRISQLGEHTSEKVKKELEQIIRACRKSPY